MIIRALAQVFLLGLPWNLRRRLLNLIFGFEIAPGATIGFSLILSRHLVMAPGSRIGHFNICRTLELLQLNSGAVLGRFNIISSTPKSSSFFKADMNRFPALILEENAVITNSHRFDCCDSIRIGSYTVVAGWGSQFITHGIDVMTNCQRAGSISIGRYCFVGSRSVILKNSALPDCSVLAAGAVLVKAHTRPYGLYGGCPAVWIKALGRDGAYFSRVERDVY